MGLIHDHRKVFREVVDEARRPLPGLPAGDRPGVVLDARRRCPFRASSRRRIGSGFEALCLQELARRSGAPAAARQLDPNPFDRPGDRRPLGDEVGGRVDAGAVDSVIGSPVSGSILLIRSTSSPQSSMTNRLLGVRREYLDRVPPYAERPRLEAVIVALVLDAHEVGQDSVPSALLPRSTMTMSLRYSAGSPKP